MKFTNLTEELIPLKNTPVKKQYFKLFATSRIQKISKKYSKLIFFNRRAFMLKNNYYRDGFLKTKSTHLRYKKAYKLSNKLYLFDVKGTINHQKVKAKELVYNGYKEYLLKHCEVKEDSKILRRKEYLIREN